MTQSANVTDLIHKIKVLRAYTRRTGFKTSRSENELLAPLNGNDLAEVLAALEEPREGTFNPSPREDPITRAKHFDPQGKDIERAGIK
jgi:hypothetical protein